jgi:manganese/zinc/iron transport system substrate-binding protein
MLGANGVARSWKWRVALALGLAPLAGCQPAGDDLGGRALEIVTTTGMIADIVREVGGDRVRVTALMGPGVDPHLFKASEGDVGALAAADIIFYNGLHLEAKMGDVFAGMRARVPAVAVAEAVDPAMLLRPPEFAGAFDPHVWMDVTLWKHAVERVAASLAGLDTLHAEGYRGRARAYLAVLDSLDGYVHEQLARLPADRRVLVTAHDAFNYFGRAYDVDVRGLQGLSTATEAGTADVRNLAAFIAERRLPAIFVESSISSRTIEAVQAAARALGHDVRIGGSLYSDALGSPGSDAESYVGMIRHNVDTIVAALLEDTP